MKQTLIASFLFSFLLSGCGSSPDPLKLEGNWIGSRYESNLSVDSQEQTQVRNWSEVNGSIYIFRNSRYKEIAGGEIGSAEDLHLSGNNYYRVDGNFLVLESPNAQPQRYEIMKLNNELLRLRMDLTRGNVRGSVTITFTRVDGRRFDQIMVDRQRAERTQSAPRCMWDL